MTTFAIGDIQGCHAPLKLLLQHIDSTSAGSKLVFVGDLVNRGPQSLEALRQIRSLGNRARAVLGNHDLHLLAAAHGIREPHSSDTFEDILNAPDRNELLEWLRHQPLAILDDGYLFVHAGVLPQWTAAKTLALAEEVHMALRGPDWLDFLRHMYGNQPSRWDDNLAGIDRLRCVVNALTRLRFCSEDGTMEFQTKEGAGAAPAGFMPWFDVPGRRTADVTIVCGHWSTLGLKMRADLIALDTGCVWGGKLTAVRLEDREILQVCCPQFQRPQEPLKG